MLPRQIALLKKAHDIQKQASLDMAKCFAGITALELSSLCLSDVDGINQPTPEDWVVLNQAEKFADLADSIEKEFSLA